MPYEVARLVTLEAVASRADSFSFSARSDVSGGNYCSGPAESCLFALRAVAGRSGSVAKIPSLLLCRENTVLLK
jgi:hypothetical protein